MKNGALIIVQNLSFPLDRRVWREASYLNAHGFNTFVISPTGKNQDKKLYENINGINVFRFPLITDIGGKYYYFIEYLWSFIFIFFISLFLLPKVNFIQVCNPPDIFFPIGWLCRLFNKKFVFDHHDLCPELFLIKFKNLDRKSILYNLLLWCECHTVKSAHRIISVNENYKKIILERHKVKEEKIIVSRNLPDPKVFKRVNPNLELRKEKEHLITYHGVMGEADSVEIIIFAANELKSRGINNFHISIIGDGPTRINLINKTKELDLSNLIDFPGRVSNEKLLEYLSTASFGLLPDLNNPFNDVSSMNKTVEYLTIGLPFIAFDLKETMDTAKDSALYARNNDYKDFANKIQELLGNKRLLEKLKINSIERLKDFSYEETMRNYLSVFK